MAWPPLRFTRAHFDFSTDVLQALAPSHQEMVNMVVTRRAREIERLLWLALESGKNLAVRQTTSVDGLKIEWRLVDLDGEGLSGPEPWELYHVMDLTADQIGEAKARRKNRPTSPPAGDR